MGVVDSTRFIRHIGDTVGFRIVIYMRYIDRWIV
jgi:hypothetical protein